MCAEGKLECRAITRRISEATMRSARLSPTLAIMLAAAVVLPAAAQDTVTDPAAEMPPPISEHDDLESAVVFIRASGQFADPSGRAR
jgi:hypothetical protein